MGAKDLSMLLNELFEIMDLSLEQMSMDELNEITKAMAITAKLTELQIKYLAASFGQGGYPYFLTEAEKLQLLTNGCLVEIAEGVTDKKYAPTVFGRKVFMLIKAQECLKDRIVGYSKREWRNQIEQSVVNSVVKNRTKDLADGIIDEAADVKGEFATLWAAANMPNKLEDFSKELVEDLCNKHYLSYSQNKELTISKLGSERLGTLSRRLSNLTGANLWANSIIFYSDQPNSLYGLINEFMIKNKPLDEFHISLFKGYGFLNRKGSPTKLLIEISDKLSSLVNNSVTLKVNTEKAE